MKIISIFFAIFFLFNSGFVYEIVNDNPASISLSQENIKKYANVDTKVMFYTSFIPEQDFFSTIWLSKNMNNNSDVYKDRSRTDNLLLSYGGIKGYFMLSNSTNKTTDGSYIYLSYLNTFEQIMHGPGFRRYWNTTELYPFLDQNNKVYTNNGSVIYKKREKA